MKIRHLLSAAAVAMLTAAWITGCGANTGNTAGQDSTKSTGVADAEKSAISASTSETTSFPITMKHAYGETVIKEKPDRIVTLNWNNADSILALGLIPVGVSRINWGPVTEKGILPWTEAKFKELGEENPNVFNDLDGFDYEAIAGADPDIIVAPYSGMEKKEYDRLSEIAPTIPFKDIAWKTTWREQLIEAAEAVGRKAEGEKIVADTDTFIKETMAKYPELAGKSAALCYISAADLSNFSVYRTIDPRAGYLVDMGFRFPEKVEEQATDKDSFYVQISSELAVETLSDLDIIITYGDDKTFDAIKNDAIFSKIPAVREGRVVVLDNKGSLSAACNPSVLSIKAELTSYLDAISAVVK